MLEALIIKFAQIEDPRCDWRVEHKLLDILVIAVCAVIGEAESFEDIALYGRCKRDWLGRLPSFNDDFIETRLAYHTESIAVFVVDKKVRILISKYDADYYVLIG